MKIPTLIKLAAVPLLPLALSACGNKGTNPSTGTTTPPVATFQDKAGAPFATLFNAAANSDPRHVTSADVPALSLTTDPFDN
jgi:hypothetical protein